MAIEGAIVSVGDGTSRAMPVPEGLVLDVAGRRLEVTHVPRGDEEQIEVTGLRALKQWFLLFARFV